MYHITSQIRKYVIKYPKIMAAAGNKRDEDKDCKNR